MASIRICNLSHRYDAGSPQVLDAVSLAMADAEAHALLGPSGCGKTTLLKLLAGLLKPEAGRIEIAGQDQARTPPAERQTALVFQFPVLYPTLSVTGNLAFPLANQGWRRDAIQSRVREVVDLLGLGPLLSRRPQSLSQFEKQLVVIGRALVRPDLAVLLLDEPLAAVEAGMRWRLRLVLKQVQADTGLTMILVTHDQTEALAFAERTTVMHQGRALQTASAQTLVDAPAHPEVARFIGDPGMNLAPAQVQDGQLIVGGRPLWRTDLPAGPCLLGFRPEWASVAETGVPVRLLGIEVLGRRSGRTRGLVTVEWAKQRIRIRQAIQPHQLRQPDLRLELVRSLLFRDDQMLEAATLAGDRIPP